MSDTIIVAIITAIATTVPQILISMINNKHQLKIKQYETKKAFYQSVVDEFIENVTACMDGSSGLIPKQSINFYKSVNKIQVYFPSLKIVSIQKLINSIEEDDDTIRLNLEPIINQLSRLLSEI